MATEAAGAGGAGCKGHGGNLGSGGNVLYLDCDGGHMTLVIYQNTQNCGLDFLHVSPSAEAIHVIETMKETAWEEKSMKWAQGNIHPEI